MRTYKVSGEYHKEITITSSHTFFDYEIEANDEEHAEELVTNLIEDDFDNFEFDDECEVDNLEDLVLVYMNAELSEYKSRDLNQLKLW